MVDYTQTIEEQQENTAELVWPDFMPFKVVRQTGPRECAGCAAAMLTGTSLEDFKAWASTPAPWSDIEIYKYCELLNVWVGPSLPVECFAGPWYITLKDKAAWLVVDLHGVDHAVVWNGDAVGDSMFNEPQPPENYTVKRIGIVCVC